jgi:hypothetical protein
MAAITQVTRLDMSPRVMGQILMSASREVQPGSELLKNATCNAEFKMQNADLARSSAFFSV